MLSRWGATLLLGALFLLSVGLAGAQAGDCYSPANLTTNCDFNTFTDQSSGGQIRQIVSGWNLWVEAGSLAVDQAVDSPSPPSQRFWSNGDRFIAGLWQQVSGVTPGATYLAGLVWAPHGDQCENCIERKVGIDPTGGTDPLSPNVVWGEPVYERKPFDTIRVRAVAQSSTITMFIRVANPVSHGIDEVFLDGAWMYQDTSAPVVAEATATPLPPTATAVPSSPVPPAPAEAPLPTQPVAPTATFTAEPSPTAEPTAAPEPTATLEPSPTATATPAATPSSTATSSPVPTPSQAPAASPRPLFPTATPPATMLLQGGGFGWGPVVALFGLGGVLFFAGTVWRRHRSLRE